ncbi:MAG TPA: isoprenylcysteine carboxylmethyltransferase family protein [Acidobacteriota bacterium]|nr:isoprenylcysteine carboxylmethyltransferase family protein [Acidobacteriota bacterium]
MRKYRRNLGIPLVLLAAYFVGFNTKLALPSTILVVAGEALRLWAAGHLRKESLITTGGPYGFVRNPLYIGSFLIAIGFCLISDSIWVWVLVFAYFLLCYLPVIRFEEKVLREKFPKDYSKYASIVPALFPTLRPYPNPSTKFSWRQVMVNKEYNAVLGIALTYAFLIIKAKVLASR